MSSDTESDSDLPVFDLNPAIADSICPRLIPAMSAECERVFSSAKKLITPERNRLNEQIIEASECLKNWWDRGLIQQQPDVPGEDDSVDCELNDEDDDI